MPLQPLGATSVDPRTFFFWEPEEKAAVEITVLSESQFLVRASKSYRLLKQDEQGRTWIQNLSKLNDYLADKFPSFQITVNYSNQVSPETLGFLPEAVSQAEEAQTLLSERNSLNSEIHSLKLSVDHGFDEFTETISEKLTGKQEQVERLEARIDEITELLQRKKDELGEWKKNGASLSYLFTFSNDPDIVRAENLDQIVEKQLKEVQSLHEREARQRLQQSKFKLRVEELTEPRVFHRTEHSSLLNPDNLQQLIDQNQHLEEPLKKLQKESAIQYQAYALSDLSLSTGTFERKRTTPAHAVKSILENLETIPGFNSNGDAPNTGPYVGTIPGTKQVVGFDPAELPHYYIAGETGSGKTYLKKVLTENCASLGYDVLSINPGDQETLGLSFPNPGHENGVVLPFDQYWIGDDRLLDKPDDIKELFSGLNGVTLQGLPDSDKQEFVDEVFTAARDLGDLTKPLFIFLEEAHNFNKGTAADAIQDLVREGRKFMVHVGIVTQSPMEFQRNHKTVRENTTTIFLAGEYFDYADDFLDDRTEIRDLETGQAILQARDFPKTIVDVRDTLTLPTKPSESQLSTLVHRFSAEHPEPVGNPSSTLTQSMNDEVGTRRDLEKREEQVLEFIREYISEHDEAPSYSKCWREGPHGSETTRKLLEQLVAKNHVTKREVDRYGNKFTVYQPTNQA